MKKTICFLILIAVIFTASTTIASSKVIGEYAPDCFAVKGEIDVQVDSLLGDIRKEMEVDIEQKKLSVSVVGYADSTGDNAKNDRVAAERAFQVASIIQIRFPEALVKHHSRGADLEVNKRQVVVEYEFLEVEPLVQNAVYVYTEPEKVVQETVQPENIETNKESVEKKSALYKVLAPLGLILFGLCFGFVFLKKKKPDDEVKEEILENYSPEIQEVKKTPINPELKGKKPTFLDFVFMGKKYVFLPEIKGGKYVSLKKVPGKDNEYFMFSNLKDIKGSLKSSFKQEPGLLERLRKEKRLLTEEDPEYKLHILDNPA